jgi:predicted MFS family arabinose efflux permease
MADASGLGGFAGVFLTYNILAFMTQPFTGILVDKVERRHWVLLASMALLAVAVLTASMVVAAGTVIWGMHAVAVLLGFGNSLFHVWGGKQVIVTHGNDMPALGLFVSTGALGLSLGVVFYSWLLLQAFLLALCLLALAYVSMDDRNDRSDRSDGVEVASRYGRGFVLVSMAALVAFVLFRSFSGEMFSSGAGVDKTQVVVVLMGAVAMLGKMAGGWLAKWFGIVPSVVVVLVLVAVCFVIGGSNLAILLIGIFMVNCTMPVTLYLANVVLAGREGLAFGILAAALIPGYLLAVF